MYNPFHKYGKRKIEVRRARREFFFRLSLVALAVLFFAAMIVVSKFSPTLDEDSEFHSMEPGNTGDPLKNPVLIAMREEVDNLLESFEARRTAQGIEPEDLDLLNRAIEKQREIIRHRGSEIAPRQDLDRMEELLTLLDEEMGSFLIAQSRRLQEEAETLMREGNPDEAISALTTARNLQTDINEQYPRSSDRDPARLKRIENRLMTWETKPMADDADARMEQALAFLEEERYEEARTLMKEALELQQRLNESYRDSRYASFSRLRRFEMAWASVQVTEDANSVKRLLEEADAALAAENPARAASLTEEAYTLQTRIEDTFPGHEAADPRILRQIVQFRDTSASLPDFLEIRNARDSVRRLLREREMANFQNEVSEWLRLVNRFQTNFPDSGYLAEIEEDEVAYLHQIRELIPTLLETLYANILPVPGHPGVSLYRTEVPQILFEQIMQANPSVNEGAQLPVDSVTWNEAVEFTRRLSWISARPAALPDREIMMAAIGERVMDGRSDSAWSANNTDRLTRPVGTSRANAAGFHDLLGNVSEWLGGETGSIAGMVTALGGSVRDNAARLNRVPTEDRSEVERNRFVGFRFVIMETEDDG